MKYVRFLNESNDSTYGLLEEEQIFVSDKGETKRLISVADIPTTMKGAAKHNVSNSMGAAALCYALDISFDDIATGLKNFNLKLS